MSYLYASSPVTLEDIVLLILVVDVRFFVLLGVHIECTTLFTPWSLVVNKLLVRNLDERTLFKLLLLSWDVVIVLVVNSS